jgi:hypothetical protein
MPVGFYQNLNLWMDNGGIGAPAPLAQQGCDENFVNNLTIMEIKEIRIHPFPIWKRAWIPTSFF